MQHTLLLHTILEKSQAIKHEVRLKSLMLAVGGVLAGSDLSLTGLGRHMPKGIKPRSKIQEINYLLGNGHLRNERLEIYRALNQWMIGEEKQLFIIVDWSPIVAHQHHLLRASLIRKGRSMTVYEEIHPESVLGNREVHCAFLKNLKRTLPASCEICVIVDAGFRTDFFVQVETENWDYVGRVLSNMHYLLGEEKTWQACPLLYEQATSEPQAVGQVKLSKANKIESHLYLYKKLEKENEGKKGIWVRKIKYRQNEKEYKNSAKKPWLIASSFKISPEKVMAIYRKRMKIEHDFRDSKDPKWGLGLRRSRSMDPGRLSIQLLIGALAAFVLWLIGLCLEKKGLHRDFQANSVKHKRVLSLVFLALEAIRSGYLKFIKKKDFLSLKKDGLSDETLCANFVSIT